MPTKEELLDILYRLSEYMADRQDADLVGDPPEYKPNEAMCFLQEIDKMIDEIESNR